MKISVLCENTTTRNDIIPEHGLSLYIETEHHKILFDMGQTDAYLHNAEQQGICIDDVDIAFLSHGHYDHGGGMKSFLSVNNHAPIYLNQSVFGLHYNGPEKYIGLDRTLASHKQLVFVEDDMEIDKELSLYSCNHKTRKYKTDAYGLKIMKNGTLQPDDFLHEQYLLIQEQNKKILISGCSHKGILNITDWFQPDIFIGGFHFTKLNPETEDKNILREAAELLLAAPSKYYTCHCTGTKQYDYLKGIMGNRLEYISDGDSIII